MTAGWRWFESRRQEAKVEADERRRRLPGGLRAAPTSPGGPVEAAAVVGLRLLLIGCPNTPALIRLTVSLVTPPRDQSWGWGRPRGRSADARRLFPSAVLVPKGQNGGGAETSLPSAPLIGCRLAGEQIKASTGDFSASNRHNAPACGDSLPVMNIQEVGQRGGGGAVGTWRPGTPHRAVITVCVCVREQEGCGAAV